MAVEISGLGAVASHGRASFSAQTADTSSKLPRLRVEGAGTIRFGGPVLVSGDLTVGGTAAVGSFSGGTVTVRGTLGTAPGTTVEVSDLRLEHRSGVEQVEGAFAPGQVTFAAAGQTTTLRPLDYRAVIVAGGARARLGGAVNVASARTVTDAGSDVDLAGHALTLADAKHPGAGHLYVRAGGTLTMRHAADRLTVHGARASGCSFLRPR